MADSAYSGGGPSPPWVGIGLWLEAAPASSASEWMAVSAGAFAVFGVGEGVISVDGVTSTSSASRYHLRRRV